MEFTTTELDRRQVLIDPENLDVITINDKEYHCRVVPSYEDYLATTCGNVISKKFKQPKLLKPKYVNKTSSYFRVCLNGKNLRIHRVIASAFLAASEVPCRRGGIRNEVNHIDNDPSNNKVANLEIVSRKENMAWNIVLKKQLRLN